MFYFFKRGTETVQCEVRASEDGHGYEIIVTEGNGHQRTEKYPTSDQVHQRWLELNDTFTRDGWWGPATQDGRG